MAPSIHGSSARHTAGSASPFVSTRVVRWERSASVVTARNNSTTNSHWQVASPPDTVIPEMNGAASRTPSSTSSSSTHRLESTWRRAIVCGLWQARQLNVHPCTNTT
jgi:hypothetical protein